MITWIKTHSLLLLISLFTITRIVNLTLLPIFIDEANYLDWGWRSLHLPHFLFYSLYDGKQPLLIWLFGLSEIIFPDPLFAGRLVSLLSGLTCLLGIFFTTRKLFDSKTAYLASLFYIVVPIFLFFDRQALMETSIAAVGIWSFYFLNRFLEKPNVKSALLLGLTLAVGVWIKNSSLLFIISFFAVLLLYLFLHPKKTFPILNYSLIILITLITLLFPLFFQPDFWASFHLNGRYSLGLSELLRFPFSLWTKNLLGTLNISFVFLTPLVFLPAIYGLIKFRISHKYFLVWTVIPLLQIIFTTRALNLRYPASFLPPLIIFAAAVIPKKIPHILLVLLLPIFISATLLVNPPQYFSLLSRVSSYSYIDDYVTGHLTGYLVNHIVSYINHLDTSQPLIITFALNSGNFEAALIDYFHKSPSVRTTYLDSRLFPNNLSQYDCFSVANARLLFIGREQQQGGLNRFFTPLDTITPDHGSDYATVYALKTDCPPHRTLSLSPSSP